jgi:hypothetical protein
MLFMPRERSTTIFFTLFFELKSSYCVLPTGNTFSAVCVNTIFTQFYITAIRSKTCNWDCFTWFYNCINLDRLIYNQRSRFETAWKLC